MRGDRLRKIRESREISQRDLANRCGMGEKQIWRYENGESEPGAEHLIKLCTHLFVSADYLLGLSQEPGEYFQGRNLNNTQMDLISLIDKHTLASAISALAVLHDYMVDLEQEIIGPMRDE
ncbi:MAG: helix-turn-helix transcriptional regulator [Aggregatilineales bacterium]